MRVILFRGKSEGNQWEYGNYCIAEKLDKSGVEYFIIDIDAEGSQHYVIPETVGQYTGLTDKNGKRMFEGDIVAGALTWLEKKKNGLVAFKGGSFGLIWYRGDIEQFNAFTSMCNIEYEVIGNVTDNPELLKGE